MAPETLSRLAIRFSIVPNSWSSADGRLEADPGDARDVVDRVAGQGEGSTTWSGATPQSALSPSTSRNSFLRRLRIRVCSSRSWRASLSAVQIDDVQPALDGPAGEGGDDVVGLGPGVDQDGDAERLERGGGSTGIWGTQVVGHRPALGLVVGERLGPLGLARRRRRRRRGSRACGP